MSTEQQATDFRKGMFGALLVLALTGLLWASRATIPVEAAERIDDSPAALALIETPTTTTAMDGAPTTLAPTTTATEAPLSFDGPGGYVAKAIIEEGIVDVWSEPDAASAPAWNLAVPTEFFGPRYFQVIGQQGEWLEIAVPVRPNGTTGWIPKDAVTVAPIDTRVTVDLSERTLIVTRNGEVVAETVVSIGKSGTPTPVGNYYLRDELPWDETSVYGPFVLALSAYSDSIEQINGGDAVVAIHGTVRPDLLGQPASLGCVRVENDVLRSVAAIIEPGTPVDIVD